MSYFPRKLPLKMTARFDVMVEDADGNPVWLSELVDLVNIHCTNVEQVLEWWVPFSFFIVGVVVGVVVTGTFG